MNAFRPESNVPASSCGVPAPHLCVFQQLPLHVRSRVLKEGVVLFTRDEDALYALAARTARAYEHFRHIQRRYLDEVARG